jgi:hypothetical protein
MHVKFEVFAPDLYVDDTDERYSHSVCVVGNRRELGMWNEEKAVPLRKEGDKMHVATVEIDKKNVEGLQYKYVVKRNSVLVRWETIPPPYRSICTDKQSDTLGELPVNHPKRVGGTSTWLDRKLCTPTGGSEFRLTVGSDKFHPCHGVSIREDMKPEKIGLQLRWGKGAEEPLKSFSQSGGNIQSRRVGFITEKKEEEERDEVRRGKNQGSAPSRNSSMIIDVSPSTTRFTGRRSTEPSWLLTAALRALSSSSMQTTRSLPKRPTMDATGWS